MDLYHCWQVVLQYSPLHGIMLAFMTQASRFFFSGFNAALHILHLAYATSIPLLRKMDGNRMKYSSSKGTNYESMRAMNV
jgi:hypothetical protein